MQGIILTGGKGTRLKPLTNHTNKHLLDVCGKPMVCYSLSIFVSCGVKDVTLVSNSEHVDDFRELLSDNFNGYFETLRFISQNNEKPGIAGSIQMMPPEIRRGPYMLILADNIIGGSANVFRSKFDEDPESALILLTEVQSPNAFGVAHFEDDLLTEIEEKPDANASHWAIAGIYFFPSDLFSFAEKVRPSRRGEYEVTDILAQYLNAGRLQYQMLPYWWVDAGTHESLARAKRLICGEISPETLDTE